MKKRYLIFLIIIIFLPVCVYGSTFSVPETDIIITIDEDIWVVFTRHDIKDKELLKQYGISYEEINESFASNNIYLYAYAYLDDELTKTIDMNIYKMENLDKVKNINELSENDIENITNALVKSSKASLYDYYVNDDTTYIYYRYKDNKVYVVEYFTIVNGNNYYLTFKSLIPFTDDVLNNIDEIVDKVIFKINSNINIFETITYSLISLVLLILVFKAIKKNSNIKQ